MSLQFSIALVFSLFCLTAPAWADVQAAIDAAKRGDYETAEKEFRELATEGDAIAQYHLGVMYARGHGVP
jgi:TPR repeat protein